MQIPKVLGRFVGVVCLSIVLPGSTVFGGGPSQLAPGGIPVRWSPARVGFVIDNGPLGPNTRDQAASIVRAGFKVWEDVETSAIAFDDLGFLNVDIDITNYRTYLEVKRPEGNVIAFDSDGSITDDFFGEGSGEILGFAAARRSATSNLYDFAFAVLNGPSSGSASFQGTMIHEFGHLIGLDHTQAGFEQAFNGITADNTNIPIMFPYRFPFAPNDLRPDDTAWISWLYPTANFTQATGTIKGQVFYPPGTPLPGANVVAVQVAAASSGVTESKREMVSVVSDFLVKGDGSFEIPGVAPGDYVVFIEPLFSEFIQGSGVGPFDHRFENFFKDYYNGPAESDQDDPGEKIAFRVTAGQEVNRIDLVANQIFNRLDLLSDDGEMLYKFPDGFVFPFFGKTYSEVFVNADGNLTFGKGDGVPAIPRDPDRFLKGPPRIAPLFTDLNPSQVGEVTATAGNGEITFTWDGVPEFRENETPPPNRFSVTLFSNGNIRFTYPQLNITPDEDDRFPGGLQAVVGVTPGAGAAGQTVDLSASPSIPLADKPIYEVFPGTSLDLQGLEVNFVNSNAQLLFPLYAGNALTFSSYAFTNDSFQDAVVLLEARGTDGSVLSLGDNPHAEAVKAHAQVAKLGHEYFGIPVSTVQGGWIRVTSTTPSVASFFQIGDGLAGPVTRLDGSIAIASQSKTLFFSRIYDGLAVFPTFNGFQDATTRISVANPNATPITVRFTFFAPTGQQFGLPTDRTVPPNGFLLERVSTLIDTQTPLNDGYLRADVIQGAGAIGLELIELEQALLALNASPGNPGQVLFSAQLASGTDTGVAVFTSVKLVNTSSENRVVTITPYRGDGVILSTPLSNVTIQPNQTFQFDAGSAFGGSPLANVLGSLLIEADGPGIIGDVVFGDPFDARFAAALPLQTVRFTRAIFSHVANGQLGPDPSMDCFTGIALFNPNTQDAQVSVKVFDEGGHQVGNAHNVTLGPRHRMSELVEFLVSGTSDLIRGYISVDSSLPLVAQQLFGNASLSFLSAVPPQILQ